MYAGGLSLGYSELPHFTAIVAADTIFWRQAAVASRTFNRLRGVEAMVLVAASTLPLAIPPTSACPSGVTTTSISQRFTIWNP